MKKQTFLQSAVILMIANAISKILGAVFKIPLTYILGEEGMAIYNAAFTVYGTALSFIVSGMPLALTKIISEEYALGHSTAVHKAMNVSLALLSLSGAVVTAVIYFIAPWLANIMNDPSAVYAIKIISPSVFFVAVGVMYKSYYQGVRYMTPIAVSQIVESVIKLCAGYMLALYMSRFSTAFSAGGAVGGIAVGEITATAVLIMLCRKPEKIKDEKSLSAKIVLMRIFSVAAPVMAASSIGAILSFIDVAMVRSRLCDIVFNSHSAAAFLSDYGMYTDLFDSVKYGAKITAEGARWLYGSYSGYAITIFHLPTGIIGAMCMGVFPAISAASAVGNYSRIKALSENALRITIMLALPCSAVLYFFSEEILLALFNNCAAAPMLKALAPCTIAVCVAQICGTILQGVGKIKLPLIYGLVSNTLKPVIGWFLIAVPSLNICGAAVSACICCTLEMGYSLVLCRKYAHIRPKCIRFVIKPLLAAAVMSAVMLRCYPYMQTVLVKNLYALFAVGIIGCGIYFGLLAIMGALKKDTAE